ncbi:hypothetical protein SDRG_08607 [Saprolegnia diclina VS20]|uniref:EamA domain-containing protein n=1 Tax=Saprolegnia diclina (strain VS20) TaxID=1156394 RepID=T0QGR7_SAPDV|nr:hypothetical protein SDRG_08607 [Saprolegnia diclina VS20]EQC33926.1 hypothetical protein SDRG_08607 [Saprolegnia diclina VS20]|eukprot:XP_008612721.1 hypothetical protein SDRG_08607 [Saprolegnia diclina VS20]
MVPDLQLAFHRIVWACAILGTHVLLKGEARAFLSGITSWRLLLTFVFSSALIFANWYLLVWAVNAGFIVEAALGLFINPMFSVVFGVLVFHERLRLWQWVAVGLALAGVLVCAIGYGKVPYIALSMAITFAIYGVIKKQTTMLARHGMLLETLLVCPLAIAYLVYVECTGTGAFLHGATTTSVLLVGGGVVTIVPLLLFSMAAQLIPLSLLGILQYIAPTMQFLFGVLMYDEPLTTLKLMGFVLVWAALAVYSGEGLWQRASKVPVEVDTTLDDACDDDGIAEYKDAALV